MMEKKKALVYLKTAVFSGIYQQFLLQFFFLTINSSLFFYCYSENSLKSRTNTTATWTERATKNRHLKYISSLHKYLNVPSVFPWWDSERNKKGRGALLGVVVCYVCYIIQQKTVMLPNQKHYVHLGLRTYRGRQETSGCLSLCVLLIFATNSFRAQV